MKKSARVKINGKDYIVEVEDIHASPIRVRVNDRFYQVDFETIEPSKGEADRAAQQTVPTSTQGTTSAAEPASTIPVRAEVENAIIAPMPGTIMEIKVKVGDKISIGQEICKLEAMKMKNSIKSPLAGSVALIEVSEGQKVAYGQTLVRFE